MWNANVIGKWILQAEGGYVNIPNDPGGETKYGIAKASHPNVDIKNLTLDEALAIYKQQYWNPFDLDNMPLYIAIAIFDTAVNMGGNYTAKMMDKYGKLLSNPTNFLCAIMAQRLQDYAMFRNWNTFGKGWVNRIAHLMQLIAALPKNS